MKFTFCLTLVVVLACNHSRSQERISQNDFVVGPVSIDRQIGQVLNSIGPPSKIDTLSVFGTGDFFQYRFDGLTIWVNRPSNAISSFDISNPNFSTRRGLKVGDSISKMKKLYGRGSRKKQLNRLYDIYDVAFKDFTEIVMYGYLPTENDVLYLVFYIKDSKVVKIYLYRGLDC